MRRAISLFLIFILLNMQNSIFAQEAGNGSSGGEFVCETTSLSQQESQNILELLKDGFGGNKITSGAPPNTDRDKLSADELILTDPEDRNVAAKVKIPNEKMEPFEVSQFLNRYIKGPFAFGLVLDDSLRTARCKEYGRTCSVVGANLKYRNSQSGLKGDVVNVYRSFKGIWDANADFPQFTEEENEILRAAFNEEDKNNFNMKVVKRLEKELIPNSILTKSFEAKMSTNCTNMNCVLSSYSMFDKYYNSWLSSEMVASTFGPMLLYRMKKLFDWTGTRVSFVRHWRDKYADKLRRNFETADSFLGRLKIDKMQARIDKYGFRDFYDQLHSGDPRTDFYIIKTSDFQTWWAKQGSKGGYLDSVDTLEKRAQFIRMLKDMKSVWRAGEANLTMAESAYKHAVREYGADTPQAREALVQYGKEAARWMNIVDDELRADLPWWFLNTNFSQLYDKGVRSINTGEVINLNDDPRHFRRILDKFTNDGDWRGFEQEKHIYDSVYETVKAPDGTDLGLIQLYGFDTASKQKYRGLSYGNLERAAKDIQNVWANTDYGEYIRFNPQSVPLIQSRIAGNAELFQGNWTKIHALTPEELSMRLTNGRTRANMRVALHNIDQMLDTVKERSWVSRRYWSALDKLFAQEDELIKAYFSVKGGVKWTAYPFGYWWAKKGFGIEDASMYQLPDTWSEVTFYEGTEPIYDDAYIDFFANEGSDQGDMFVQVLNILPWKMVMDEISRKFNPLREMYDKLTKNELRNEAEDLAFYLTGPNECVGCSMVLKSSDLEDFSPFFVANKTLDSYILEDTRTQRAREVGQTIIAYGHHTNLKGEREKEGEPIDLVEAEKEGKTCRDAVQNSKLGLAWVPGMPEEGVGPAVAAVMGTMESLVYVTFFWAGIFGSVAMQFYVAPQFHDCVDTEEGYYVHYFIPTEKETEQTQDLPELSTEKVTNFVGDLKDSFVGSFSGDGNSMTRDAVEQIGNEIDKFVRNAKESNIVQAKLSVFGRSSGQLTGKKLFYFWCGEGCEMHAAEYRTEGKQVIHDTERGIAVGFDYNKGRITRNGVPIVTNKDIVRMSSTNLNIPAEEIPHTITTACISDSNNVAIEINTRGEAIVRDSQLLDCIKDGVEKQHGLGMDGENLYDVFGKAEVVVTDTHPSITPQSDNITAEGMPRKIAEGSDSMIYIKANKKVELSSSNDNIPQVGNLKSVQFKNGSIVVKPDGCLLIWLRHHESGILEQNMVKGLDTELSTSTNPETGCEEPAINLQVQGDSESPYSMAKAEEFNTALEHLGPFQVFDTPTKRYVFYSGPPPECKPHMRIIDKETGEITDMEGEIVETPTGIKFIEDDGTEHTLDFGVKDGVPIVTYDDGKPEPLLTAQGRNGAFWYDPEKGLWYAENAQLLPLIEAFRKGIAAQVGPGGEAAATASGNVLNLELGADGGGFLNLPSLPKDTIYLLLFIASLMAVIVGIRIRKRE